MNDAVVLPLSTPPHPPASSSNSRRSLPWTGEGSSLPCWRSLSRLAKPKASLPPFRIGAKLEPFSTARVDRPALGRLAGAEPPPSAGGGLWAAAGSPAGVVRGPRRPPVGVVRVTGRSPLPGRRGGQFKLASPASSQDLRLLQPSSDSKWRMAEQYKNKRIALNC